MKSLKALNQLQKTSSSLLAAPVPVSVDAAPVKKQLQFITEMTFIYILKLLGVGDEKKLAEIVSRLRRGTPFYDFTFLAHNLAKSKTDFDFLSSPENIPVYAKIAEVSRDCGVVLLPYVNVLARIAENKQYGLYSENQEVGFFLDEYHRYKDSVDAKEFLHQFKKILKYETQKLFERFISDGIFSLIRQTLSEHSSKIAGAQALAAYVYCQHYYQSDISNADENFLHAHIGFCVNYLASHGEITFSPIVKQKLFPDFADEKEAAEYFFSHNGQAENSVDTFIGLLKDVCQFSDINDFCVFLRERMYKSDSEVFNDKRSKIMRLVADKIRERANNGSVPLYNDICKLLPQRFLCERSPNILRHGGNPLYIFNDSHGEFLFYAHESGNFNKNTPDAHSLLELEILEKDRHGYAALWKWHYVE